MSRLGGQSGAQRLGWDVYLLVASVLLDMGEEKGMAFLEKLAAQNLTNIQSSARAVVDQLVRETQEGLS